MHPRKRLNLVLGITCGALISLITIFHSDQNSNNGIINFSNLHFKDLSRKTESSSYLDEKLKLNEKTNKKISDYDFDCSKVDAVGQVPNRNQILESMDYQVLANYNFPSLEKHEKIYTRPMLNCLESDDPYLAKSIKETLMLPPTVKKFVRKEEQIDFYSKQELDVIEMVFKDLKPGFFIEAGAGDCTASITNTLETQLNWTGLLVEALPEFFQSCGMKKRNAWLVNNCLAKEDKPHYIDYNVKSVGLFNLPNETDVAVNAMQGFSGDFDQSPENSVEMQCLPLVSLLYALGNPTVNFFVLDIEGFELAVLRTIPWDKVDIEVLSIETDLAGKFQLDSSRQAIIDIMVKNGYTRFDHRNDINKFTGVNQNDLFVRNDIVVKHNVTQITTPLDNAHYGGNSTIDFHFSKN